jgi:hypothetical protein
MFAGGVAVADQAAGHSLGDLGPALYRLGTSDHTAIYDVTAGNNTQAGSGIHGYAAGTGGTR